MELVIFDSRANSGTTKHFAKQLAKMFGVPCIAVTDVSVHATLPSYILCTYTIGYGEVPETTQAFLTHHHAAMSAVVANGSANFRAMGFFGKAGERISAKYNVELLGILDMGGTREDLTRIAKRVAVLSNKASILQTDEVRPLSQLIGGRFKLHPLY